MNLACFTTSWWDDRADVAAMKAPELNSWYDRMTKLFHPSVLFVATACEDLPELNPLKGRAEMVRFGCKKSKPYDPIRWAYCNCSLEAALNHALTLPWDLLIDIEADAFTRGVNWPVLFKEFQSRPELLLAPAWWDSPETNIMVMKREAIPQFFNNRKRKNLVEDTEPTPMLCEEEFALIFQGKWWNPWRDVRTIRQEYGVVGHYTVPDETAMTWPFVRLPSPKVRAHFEQP